MKRVFRNSVFGALFVMLCSPLPAAAKASAEKETVLGSRFKREKYDDLRAQRQTMNYYGRCLAESKQAKIEAFLLEPTVKKFEDITSTPNNETHCAARNFVAGYVDARGSLAEGWYLKAFDRLPNGFKTAENKAPPQEEVVARIIAADEDSKSGTIVDEFARCVAATAPIQVDAFLRTTVDSQEELAAIGKISPYFSPCAFEGQDMSFDVASLRYNLAFALASRAAHMLHGMT